MLFVLEQRLLLAKAKIPSETDWYADYATRYTHDFAPAVNGRSDAWISIWNEPFMWDGSDDVTAAVWLAEMVALIKVIRDAGTENILVIPCGLMGQDESALLAKTSPEASLTAAQELLQYDANLVFDV